MWLLDVNQLRVSVKSLEKRQRSLPPPLYTTIWMAKIRKLMALTDIDSFCCINLNFCISEVNITIENDTDTTFVIQKQSVKPGKITQFATTPVTSKPFSTVFKAEHVRNTL